MNITVETCTFTVYKNNKKIAKIITRIATVNVNVFPLLIYLRLYIYIYIFIPNDFFLIVSKIAVISFQLTSQNYLQVPKAIQKLQPSVTIYRVTQNKKWPDFGNCTRSTGCPMKVVWLWKGLFITSWWNPGKNFIKLIEYTLNSPVKWQIKHILVTEHHMHWYNILLFQSQHLIVILFKTYNDLIILPFFLLSDENIRRHLPSPMHLSWWNPEKPIKINCSLYLGIPVHHISIIVSDNISKHDSSCFFSIQWRNQNFSLWEGKGEPRWEGINLGRRIDLSSFQNV